MFVEEKKKRGREMRIEIRTKNGTNIEMDVEAINIHLSDIKFSHEYFRLVERPKFVLKLFYHGRTIDDVSKVFEYEDGSGTLTKFPLIDEKRKEIV